mmetsp:Transcript_53709/g.165239  ORF Transcript_53709/g.165239 Transcript_53709/m.165239 type:complete len:226 (-) Transcript_53709:125-802(-)
MGSSSNCVVGRTSSSIGCGGHGDALATRLSAVPDRALPSSAAAVFVGTVALSLSAASGSGSSASSALAKLAAAKSSPSASTASSSRGVPSSPGTYPHGANSAGRSPKSPIHTLVVSGWMRRLIVSASSGRRSSRTRLWARATGVSNTSSSTKVVAASSARAISKYTMPGGGGLLLRHPASIIAFSVTPGFSPKRSASAGSARARAGSPIARPASRRSVWGISPGG